MDDASINPYFPNVETNSRIMKLFVIILGKLTVALSTFEFLRPVVKNVDKDPEIRDSGNKYSNGTTKVWDKVQVRAGERGKERDFDTPRSRCIWYIPNNPIIELLQFVSWLSTSSAYQRFEIGSLELCSFL